METLPPIYNFKPRLRGDGVKPLSIFIRNKLTQEPKDLSNSKIRMWLKKGGVIAWKFSNIGDGDGPIEQPSPGVILFPLENENNVLEPGVYSYDLEIVDNTSFKRTCLRGQLPIIDDITKTVG